MSRSIFVSFDNLSFALPKPPLPLHYIRIPLATDKAAEMTSALNGQSNGAYASTPRARACLHVRTALNSVGPCDSGIHRLSSKCRGHKNIPKYYTIPSTEMQTKALLPNALIFILNPKAESDVFSHEKAGNTQAAVMELPTASEHISGYPAPKNLLPFLQTRRHLRPLYPNNIFL